MSTKRAISALTNIVGIAGLLLAGYVLVTSLPDMGRYVRITRM